MTTGRSFFEYVKNKCYNGLYEAADKYVRSNWRNLDLNAWRLDDITYVSFEDSISNLSNLCGDALDKICIRS